MTTTQTTNPDEVFVLDTTRTNEPPELRNTRNLFRIKKTRRVKFRRGQLEAAGANPDALVRSGVLTPKKTPPPPESPPERIKRALKGRGKTFADRLDALAPLYMEARRGLSGGELQQHVLAALDPGPADVPLIVARMPATRERDVESHTGSLAAALLRAVLAKGKTLDLDADAQRRLAGPWLAHEPKLARAAFALVKKAEPAALAILMEKAITTPQVRRDACEIHAALCAKL